MNNFNAPLIAGRATPRAAAKYVYEEPAVEEAVADSVEWIMVRLDLLAHYKLIISVLAMMRRVF